MSLNINIVENFELSPGQDARTLSVALENDYCITPIFRVELKGHCIEFGVV